MVTIQKYLEVYGNIIKIKPALDNNGNIINFADNNITDLFISIEKITDKVSNYGILNVEIMVPFKHLSTFWRTHEMPLLDFEISLILTWPMSSNADAD